MPPKTPVIFWAVIEPRLPTTALTAQNIRALMRNDEWIAIEYRNAQLVFIEQFAKIECSVTFDTAVLAELFKLTRSCMRAICAKAQRNQRPLDRPPLVRDHEFEPCQMIRDKAVTCNSVTKRELINYIEANFCRPCL
jgi:hypothetical protein